MVDRGRVLAAVYRSDLFNALASHVFRPLAKQPDTFKGEAEKHGLAPDFDD